MEPTSEINQLADDLAEHGLVGTIVRHQVRPLDDGYETFLDDLATLQNRPEALPIDEGLSDVVDALSGFEFFTIQRVICDLIPRLNVCHHPLLRLVDGLVRAGGADGAAGRPNAAFRTWCASDPQRSAAIYADARNGEQLALQHLAFALEAHDDVAEAIKFAGSDRPEEKLAAATALGRMRLGALIERASETLVELAKAADEQISLSALAAGFQAAARANVSASKKMEDALEQRLNMTSPQTTHLAADLLSWHAKTMSQRALDLCLRAVEAVNPEHGGTISHLDYAAHDLAAIGQIDRMVDLVGRICDRTEGGISLASFNGLMHQLNAGGPEVLGRAVVHWLLNGGTHTRRSLAAELADLGRTEPPYNVPADSLPDDAATQLFLCRKAVGWFFTDPLLAVPILLSILRFGAPDIAGEVLGLILDPLLLSYGGKLKDYLEAEAQSDHPSAVDLAGLIAQKNAMNEAMEGAEAIVELRPSESQREAERVLWEAQMKEGMENAHKKSILSDLFTKQYILYGRSSLFTIPGREGATELREMEMKSFSVWAELPLLEIFDPAGLRHMLFQMKSEARPEA